MNRQNKQREIDFFNQYASAEGDYDVFTDRSNLKIVRSSVDFGGLRPPGRMVDLGCGTGVFTKILFDLGFQTEGLDISDGLIEVARKKYPSILFKVGDVEALPYESESVDGILLSGILHHLPDLSRCAKEIFRVLKPRGAFVAFDPNRQNPFMWLYRDKSSPFYSSKGVTENERPLLTKEISPVFTEAGFQVSFKYLSGLHYRYVASGAVRWALPIYNFLDEALFWPAFMNPYRAFVLTKGVKI